MFDGKNKYSWFSCNASELFKTILQSKYKNYSAAAQPVAVYAHNLSSFDCYLTYQIFIIEHNNKNMYIRIIGIKPILFINN